jgi:hypothetical protein
MLNFHAFGLDRDGIQRNLEIMACRFHWFGVSVCSVARLAGCVHGLAKMECTRADLRDPSRCNAGRASVDASVKRIPVLAAVLV